jgi:molecular chaperone GrpE (heat shock protein)
MHDSQKNLTLSLKKMMQAVSISSWQMLSDRAGVSRRAIDSLRKGNGANLKYADLIKLAAILQINIDEFITEFINNSNELSEYSRIDINDRITRDLTVDSLAKLPEEMVNHQSEQVQNQNSDLQAEYQLLLDRLERQKQDLRSQLIREAVQQIESLILQLPSAIYAAQQNPQLPAKNILPLLRPLDALLQKWEVIAIGAVGEQIAYDPQEHELMDQAMDQEQAIAVGDRVLVRYVGYKFGDRLLHRARVALPRLN